MFFLFIFIFLPQKPLLLEEHLDKLAKCSSLIRRIKT